MDGHVAGNFVVAGRAGSARARAPAATVRTEWIFFIPRIGLNRALSRP